MIAFQKDIYLCGWNGKSEEICIKVSAPQLWKRFLIVQLLIALLATIHTIAKYQYQLTRSIIQMVPRNHFEKENHQGRI
jgi:hypothetical protein